MRLKQINLIGPAGLVSMEDGLAIEIVQQGIAKDGGAEAIVEMGGKTVARTPPSWRVKTRCAASGTATGV